MKKGAGIKPRVLVLSPEALGAMNARFLQAYGAGRETQTYLLGRASDQTLYVSTVVTPGTPHESAWMTHADYEAADREIARLLDEDGYDLIGEAHLHAGGSGPSGGDLASLRKAKASNPGYICLVQTRRGKDSEPTFTAVSVDADGDRVDHRVLLEVAPEPYNPTLPARAQETVVVHVGMGGGGCLAALQAAKLGLAELVLVDGDVLEERNGVRHLASPSDVGRSKVDWGEEFLGTRAPGTKVVAVRLEISEATRGTWAPLVSRADLIVNATGHPVVAHMLSEAARAARKPVIHAGTYEKGSGGFVFIQGPGAGDACYGCVAGGRPTISDDAKTMAELERAYGFSPAELHAQAGLWADINMVAATHARAVVMWLKHGADPSRPNFFEIDNERMTVKADRVSQARGCEVCHPRAVTMSAEEALRTAAQITVKEDNE